MVKDPGVYQLKWYDKPIVWMINIMFAWHYKAGRAALPDHLKDRRHWDYPWPFLLIPRWVTSWDWGVPQMMWGDQLETRTSIEEFWEPKGHFWLYRRIEGPGPIGEPGSWQISRYPKGPWLLRRLPLYFAFTTRKGLHFRLGARWDDVDKYVTCPSVAIRRPKAYR